MATIRESHERQLQDIADDLAALATGIGAVTAPTAAGALTSTQNATTNASAPGVGYVQAESASIATLANALKVSYNAAQVDIAALRTKLNEVITNLAAVVAGSGVTIKTVRG